MPEGNPTEAATTSWSLAEEHAAVQKLVSRKLGYALRHLGSEDITQKKTPDRKRRFVKHVFQPVSGDCEPVMVSTKAGVGPSHFRKGLARALAKLSLAEFRTPSYFGMLELGAERRMSLLHVWEYVAQEPPLSSQDWRKSRRDVVLAAAGMTSVTEEIRSKVPKLRPAISFVRPTAEMVDGAIANYSRRNLDISSLTDAALRLSRIESGAIERLKSLSGYLTHNDYCVNNVFLKPGAKPVVFDWDGASLGPPGATLRMMASLPEPELKQVVDLYCTHLASKGLALRADDVMFALRATQIFHALVRGGRRSDQSRGHSERLFRWGMDHLEYLAA